MIAATAPFERSPHAKVMVVDRSGQIRDFPRTALIDLIQPGDLVVANDAATIPASLSGVHLPSHRPIEVRLAGLPSLDPDNRGRVWRRRFSHAHGRSASAAFAWCG